MDKDLDKLIEISRFYGNNKEFVIAGGGNTSYKTGDTLWIKASGTRLATLEKDGLAVLSRKGLERISVTEYSSDPGERERQVKNDLMKALLDPSGKRPSVETSLHNLINYKYVIHLHPTICNALLCGKNSKKIAGEMFGDEVLYIDYTEAGYTLYKKIEQELQKYRKVFTRDPQVILLENHGVFVSADDTEEIKAKYQEITDIISARITKTVSHDEQEPDTRLAAVLPALRMMLSEDTPKILRYRNNPLVQHFCRTAENFEQIASPFSPDMIVYCKSHYLYIDHAGTVEELAGHIRKEINSFTKQHTYLPKVIMIRDFGLVTAEDDYQAAETVMDVFYDLMKISFYSVSFGGPRFLTREQIEFIENWEVENYRRKLDKSATETGSLKNKIAIVTGAAQGFGAGIAEHLFREGANVVVADVRQEQGTTLVDNLNDQAARNRAIYAQTDVSERQSVQDMVFKIVREFGGLDILISNAGILHAGGLDELDPEIFDRMTRVNYGGYYLTTLYCSEVMKTQHHFKSDYFTDIIQVNSKSGLRGSNRNFAYAGAKFGGIGLTQSFALELVTYNIKVNSICPGNFFDGPLWSDPETGLFIQYLKAGKVPGAKTVEDVRKFYESQVPMQRGCTVEDIMKAILYVIDQKYETGQAIAVTGGQVMLH
jgi:rhamnose utilization protein RhaD (predicted bifunctional aldolase and dehydrogenase)/NAD(P)-dependent dehydrogenase (short-subunit alcohol dehydrogenase family)